MSPASELPLAGVDGGREGIWVVVRGARRPSGEWSSLRAYVASSFEEVWRPPELPPPNLVAIDIPIGLPTAPKRGGRVAERAARARLGPRASSVFSTPCRAAMETGARLGFAVDAYRAVCDANASASPAQLRVSKQAFFILPRIYEVDTWLRAHPSDVTRTHEVHPELAFTALAGAPLASKKRAEGREARMQVLEEAGLSLGPALALSGDPRAGEDDILDACACLWSAERIARGHAESLPNPAPLDAHGLPMAICF